MHSMAYLGSTMYVFCISYIPQSLHQRAHPYRRRSLRQHCIFVTKSPLFEDFIIYHQPPSKIFQTSATIMLYPPHDPRPKWIDQKIFQPFWQAQLNEIDLPSLPTSVSVGRYNVIVANTVVGANIPYSNTSAPENILCRVIAFTQLLFNTIRTL